jgi:integrase
MKKGVKSNPTADLDSEHKAWRIRIQVRKFKMSIHSFHKKIFKHRLMKTQADATNITLERYLADWMDAIKKSRSRRTMYLYGSTIQKLINPLIGDLDLAALQTEILQTFYNHLQHHAGQSPHSIRFTHTVLKAALNQAKRLGLLIKNPCDFVSIPNKGITEMGFFDEYQTRWFLQTAQNTNDRFYPLYYLAIHTGMRMAELIGLKWRDVDWYRKTIHVQRQVLHPPGGGYVFSELKTRHSQRTILLGTKSISRLKEQHEIACSLAAKQADKWPDLDLVFPSQVGTPVARSNLRRCFYRTLKASGLPKIRFHDLRHTSATLQLNNGIPVLIVSKRLGHSKPSITMDVYGHVMPGKQEEAANLMDKLLSP